MGRSILLRARRWWRVIVAVFAALLLVAIFTLLHKPKLDVSKEATVVTADLLAATKELRQSFGGPLNSEQTTDKYLLIMNRLLKDCGRIQHYKSLPVDETTSYRLTNSVALCEDLTKLAGGSSTLYTAAQPLLASNTRTKRYQTLWPFENMIRQKHLKVANAVTQRITDHTATIEYPTQALALLKQLQGDIESRKDLGYFPALQRFQEQLLAERQQYWTGYGDLAALERSLEIQLDGYCESSASINQCNKD